ncbi:hypothetical protein [Burkholderia ubonensis]|uniref:hypothetical protein n=1 Tax=Burkholderia ubonensis TaxID=101571 RepID=UPI000AEC7FC4|nr:hypothetical protein [Burkholderia ubonensis]
MYLSHRIAYAFSILSIAASASATAHDVQNVKPTFAAPDNTTVRERDIVNTPVPVVQYGRLNVAVQSGLAEVPIAVSRDWTQP